MKPILLLIFFSSFCKAQSKLTGLGAYQIGTTTPSSLGQDFNEQDQSYVKGTIALPCGHVRTFLSPRATIEGITLTNVTLAFYDDRLFKLSCDYSDALKESFQTKHGPGLLQSTRRISLCSNPIANSLLIRGEIWQGAGIIAYYARTQGYNTDCQLEDRTIIALFSQRLSALSSDCEIRNMDPALEEFEKSIQGQK